MKKLTGTKLKLRLQLFKPLFFVACSLTSKIIVYYFPGLLASLGSSMIMFLGHFLKEHMQIRAKNGS